MFLSKVFCLRIEEISVGPYRIVCELIIVQFMINEVQFSIPEVKPFDQPKTVAPGVIVLLIALVYFHEELFLLIKIFLVNLHYASSMMPYLKVLL